MSVEEPPASPPIVRWRKKGRVPFGFRVGRYLLRFVLVFTPPITREKVVAWGWLALLVALQVALVFYISLNVTGTREVDVEVRWANYVGLFALAILGLIPSTSGAEDKRSRALDFRGGAQERAAIVDYQYAVSRDGEWIGFRLVMARKVYRILGVAAVEMPDRTFLCVPLSLFPSRTEWREIEQWLSRR